MMRILTVATLVALVCLAGCRSTGSAPPDGPLDGPGLPDWVLVVPVEEDGRCIFVGGCTMAVSAREGIEAALTDARLQITSEAGSRFTDAFALSPRESGMETTSIDRLDFRERGMALYPKAMEDAAALERIYLRSCLTGEAREIFAMPEEGDIDGAVCSVFVRVSFEADAWERNLSETLREMRQEFASSRRENLAQLADWIDARLPGSRAGDGSGEEGQAQRADEAR